MLWSEALLVQAVAPRAGAWIETIVALVTASDIYRRAPCGRVD